MFYDLIIIGGGPAGITAGIYAARKKLKFLLLSKDFVGQAGKTAEVDNYPGLPETSGAGLMEKFEAHLKKFPVEIKEGAEVARIERKGKVFTVGEKSGENFSAKTIIVATGRDPRPLKVPGEKELVGKGVSYCSICDAPLFRDKKVVVAGGGDSGFEAALDLAPYAEKIFIFENSGKLKADEILQERVREEKKIEVHLNREIKKIEGKGKVQALVFRDKETGKTFQMPIDGIFVQIGAVPAIGFLEGLCQFNKKGEVKVDFETCQTSCPGLFAAGDVNNGKWKQIVIAAAEGSRAALAAYDYLQKNF